MGAFEVNLAIVLVSSFAGAFVRSHWPRVYGYLAPVFGAASTAARQSAGLGQQQGVPQGEPLAARPRLYRGDEEESGPAPERSTRPPYGGWTVSELESFYRAMKKETRGLVLDEIAKLSRTFDMVVDGAVRRALDEEYTTAPDEPDWDCDEEREPDEDCEKQSEAIQRGPITRGNV